MDALIPKFYRMEHKGKVQKNLDQGEETSLYKSRKITVQDKEGFLQTCYIYIAPIPHLSRKFMFACLLKPIQNDSEFIILNKKGVVLSKTKAISQEITSATKSKLFSEEAGGVVTIKSVFDKGDEVLGAIQTQFLH